MLCIGCAIGLLVVEEVIKFFLRHREPTTPPRPAEAPAALSA